MDNKNDENNDYLNLLPGYGEMLERCETDVTFKTYASAMLAAQLCPELCKTKPNEALWQAEKLLWEIVLRQREIKSEVEEWRKRATALYKQSSQAVARNRKKPARYNEAVKLITRECFKRFPKLYRAKDRFTNFWAFRNRISYGKAKQQLREYEEGKKHITNSEVENLRMEYDAWEGQRKTKGKQGQLKHPEKDKRKRARPTPMPWLKSAFDGAIGDESA